MRVLVSGASVAGPTLAYWLSRHRFIVTVVERSPALRNAGAYVLAGELAVADGDHTRAFRAYESAMDDYAIRSRQFAIGAAKRLLPSSRWGV